MDAVNYHGLSYHPMFGTWYRMVRRCTDENQLWYMRYGGRGIRVHEAWLDPAAYIAYVETELGPNPAPGYSIDRIDNDGHYEPGNLRWATRSQQNANQSQRVLPNYPTGQSGRRGIRFIAKTGRFQARVSRNGRDRVLGTFATVDEAVAAREAAL